MKAHLVNDFGMRPLYEALFNKHLIDQFRIKLLSTITIHQKHPRTGKLLKAACYNSSISVIRELLQNTSKDQIDQFVNHIGTSHEQHYGIALHCALANPRKESPEVIEMLLEHGANLEIVSPSHGTPLMSACYLGRYDMVALLLRKGARTTCKKSDGTELTTVEEAKHHPEIITLLQNFEECGIEALDEPRPILLADMTKVDECMRRITEEKAKEKETEKEKKEEGHRKGEGEKSDARNA